MSSCFRVNPPAWNTILFWLLCNPILMLNVYWCRRWQVFKWEFWRSVNWQNPYMLSYEFVPFGSVLREKKENDCDTVGSSYPLQLNLGAWCRSFWYNRSAKSAPSTAQMTPKASSLVWFEVWCSARKPQVRRLQKDIRKLQRNLAEIKVTEHLKECECS